MGILEELVILVKETIEESKQQQRQQTPSNQRSPEEIEALKRQLARRAMQQREADEAAQAHEQQQAEFKRQQAEREKAQQRKHKHSEAATVAHHPAHRVAKLLRQPKTIREIIILKELLDKPISMRRGHR